MLANDDSVKVLMRLKKLRIHFRMTLDDLSKRTGVGKQRIQRLEKKQSCPIDTLIAILQYYKNSINIECLFDDNFDEELKTGKIIKSIDASIAAEKLKLFKIKLNNEIDDVIDYLND